MTNPHVFYNDHSINAPRDNAPENEADQEHEDWLSATDHLVPDIPDGDTIEDPEYYALRPE